MLAQIPKPMSMLMMPRKQRNCLSSGNNRCSSSCCCCCCRHRRNNCCCRCRTISSIQKKRREAKGKFYLLSFRLFSGQQPILLLSFSMFSFVYTHVRYESRFHHHHHHHISKQLAEAKLVDLIAKTCPSVLSVFSHMQTCRTRNSIF